MIVIGIDPGKSGGIAMLSDAGPNARAMPDTELDLLDHFVWMMAGEQPRHFLAVIEKVGATPQMGVCSAFSFGRSVGLLHATCLAFSIRIEYVTPQKWQREFGLITKARGLGQNNTAKKNRNKAKAQELFPGVKITHAIADALLIAEYGRRVLAKNTRTRTRPAGVG